MKTNVGFLVAGLAFSQLSGAEAGVKEVRIKIDTACKVDVQPDRIKVSQKKREIVVWSIANECAKREVLICLRSASPTTVTPFEECKGDPSYSAVGTQFTMFSSEATISCHINWDFLNVPFTAKVVAGEDKLECLSRGSELALEIEP